MHPATGAALMWEDLTAQGQRLSADADEDHELVMNLSSWRVLVLHYIGNRGIDDYESMTPEEWRPLIDALGLNVTLVEALPDGVIHLRRKLADR